MSRTYIKEYKDLRRCHFWRIAIVSVFIDDQFFKSIPTDSPCGVELNLIFPEVFAIPRGVARLFFEITPKIGKN